MHFQPRHWRRRGENNQRPRPFRPLLVRAKGLKAGRERPAVHRWSGIICCVAIGWLCGAAATASPPSVATPAQVAARHQQMLAEGREPAGVLREARLRWQQDPGSLESAAALLVALDEPSLRKKHLDEVVAAADRVLARVKELDLSCGERTAWLADSLYRKGRALGYMELPDVIAEHPIEDPQRHDERFEATFKQLDELVDTTRPEFVLLRIRRERRRGEYQEALRLLEIYRATAADPRWYEKKRRDIEAEAAGKSPSRK